MLVPDVFAPSFFTLGSRNQGPFLVTDPLSIHLSPQSPGRVVRDRDTHTNRMIDIDQVHKLLVPDRLVSTSLGFSSSWTMVVVDVV